MSGKRLTKKPKNAKEKQEFADGLFHLKKLLLESKYITDKVSPRISNRSKLMGREMFQRVTDMYNEMTFVDEVTLVFEDELEEDDEQMDYDSSENNLKEENEDEEEEGISQRKIPFEVKLKAVKLSESHPNWSINALRKGSTNLLKSKAQLEQWKKDVKKGGTRYDKLKMISKNVYDRFLQAKIKTQDPVKVNALIREWALEEAAKFNDGNFKFKASDAWILTFKAAHGINQGHILKPIGQKEKGDD